MVYNGLDMCYMYGGTNRHLQGTPDQQRFTIRSGVLSSTSSRWRGAFSGRPLPKQMHFGLAVDVLLFVTLLSAPGQHCNCNCKQTHLCPIQLN